MKKKLLVLAFFLVLLPLVKAQESVTWCPPGSVWHYTFYDYAISDFSKCIMLYYNGDEIVGEKLCKRITQRACTSDVIPKNTNWHNADKYTYEENGVIYLWQEKFSAFDTLFNFNAAVGDSWTIKIPMEYEDDPATKVTILSTGTEEINGNFLKKLNVEYECTDSEYIWTKHCAIYERIGNFDQHLYFAYGMYGLGFMDDEYSNSELRCYEDEGFPLYETGIVPYCDYQHVSINDPEPYLQPSVFPNPVNGEEVTISFPEQITGETEITIVDMLGKTVKTVILGQNGGTISVAGLPAGVYLLSAKNKQNIFKIKKMIINH